jgi:hypothetical protein
VPTLNLGFEYQGEHHYYDNYVFGNTHVQAARDNEKSAICEEQGNDNIFSIVKFSRMEQALCESKILKKDV